MADKYGRRLSCYVYCATYIVSCLTKHSPNFYVLLFGRLTGGVATSILFSSFESWLVAEHNKNFYPAEWLSQTLSLATLLNGVTAITAGWLGAMVRNHFDSLVAPFDLAIVFLVGAMGVMSAMWAENKGDMTIVSSSSPARSKLSEAIEVLQKDHKIALIGMIQSCFEASMYIFVFMWTPKLEALFKPLPHGQVFGCFMACSMMGSSLVSLSLSLSPSLPPSLLPSLSLFLSLFLSLCLSLFLSFFLFIILSLCFSLFSFYLSLSPAIIHFASSHLILPLVRNISLISHLSI